MYQEISKLLMYGDLSQDEILYKLGQLFEQFEVGEYNKTELVRDINTQVKRILKVATDYGFDDNLWHNYLTFFLMMSENPFSITVKVLPSIVMLRSPLVKIMARSAATSAFSLAISSSAGITGMSSGLAAMTVFSIFNLSQAASRSQSR